MPLKEAVELLRKGIAYAKRTKYKEALAFYEKAISLDPKYPEGFVLRASVYIETGRYQEAIADCNRALSLDQNCADAWSKKALGLFYLEKYEEAVLAGTRATSLNGNDAGAWYVLGVCLEETGKNDAAQAAYGRSLELEIILDIQAESKKIRK